MQQPLSPTEPDARRIAIVGQRSHSVSPGADFVRFASAMAFAASSRSAGIVVVAEDEPSSRRATLGLLRATPHLATIPIYVLGARDEGEPLADGTIADATEAEARAVTMLDVAETLPSIDPLDPDARLLRYLSMRGQATLAPERVWNAPLGYVYPIVEAFAGDLDAATWIRSLERRKLLARTTLVDRLRHCPQCDYVHLNYIDLCPSSKSIDITSMPFLHCFVCGNVAPERRFVDGGHLTCPKCTTHLRAVGVDYDRALESFHCNDCGFDFSEPDVIAECLHCGRRSAPGELVAREIFNLELSDVGRLAARTGYIGDVYAALDQLNFATPHFFFSTVELLDRMERRYAKNTFTLVGVRFADVERAVAERGYARTSLVMDEIAKRIRELVRTSDVVTRTAETDIWLLLTQTDREAASFVIDRISKLGATEAAGAGLRLECVVVASGDIAAGESAESLLARATNAFA